MTNTASTLVVLIDADDVKHVFAGWPDDICLATCLMRDGSCSMVVFRRDERDVIPQRLLQMMRVGVEDVSFVPQVQGFPTRSFKYSDERRLMVLVGSDPAILDEAIDYAVNYTYALEEGLDPAVLLGRKPSQVSVPRAQKAPRPNAEPDRSSLREISPLLPDFLRKSAEQARKPRFASVRRNKVGMLAT